MRQDLSIEQQMVQANHASHESGLDNQKNNIISSIILFGTKNKTELELLYSKFNNEIKCYAFHEPYRNIGLTAFATEPINQEKRILFKEFKLWKPISYAISQKNIKGEYYA